VPFNQGDHRHIVVSVADISIRLENEKQLTLFRTMIESASDPFYMVDLDDQCRMLYANESVARHLVSTVTGSILGEYRIGIPI
jgi:PAS domain-containing protein